MSIKAAAIIFVLVCVTALLIAAPFIYFFRRARRKQDPQHMAISAHSMNWKQAAPGLILVVALFSAYATEYIAPDSWLGLRVRTMEGKFWLFIFLWLVLYSIEKLVRSSTGKSGKGSGSR